MENNTTLQEMLNWANKEYYPFNWVIEGPYLYINNYGQEINKEDGYAHFPSIKAIRDIKYLIEPFLFLFSTFSILYLLLRKYSKKII